MTSSFTQDIWKSIVLYMTILYLSILNFCLAPPLFVTSPADVTSPPEHHVVFNCMADGVPPPTYMWTKVGGDLPPNALQSGALGQDLLLFDVTSVLSGAYQCTATNSLGSAKTSANLIVLGKLRANYKFFSSIAYKMHSLYLIHTHM